MTGFDRYLILSQSDWGDIFLSKKVSGSAYACIFVGYVLWFVNSVARLPGIEFSFRFFYAISLFFILSGLLIGIYKRKFYAIPFAVMGFNITFIITVIHHVFALREVLNVVTACYSILYFLINAIVFRLRFVFIINAFVFLSVLICAIAPAVFGAISPEPMMLNAITLSAAALLLQQLVLTVRGLLIEQIGTMKLRMSELEAKVEIESARKEAREKAVRLNRISIVEALGASIAHEINQPLAAALTYCQAVKNWSSIECQDAPETLQALAGVESNVDRAARLIENIRLLTTNKDRDYALLDLRELVRDQINLVHAEFERRGIRLLYEPSTTETKAVVCAPEVALATVNLLRNAMEAFDDPAKDAVVSVECRRQSRDWVEILVIDNGRGLSAEGIQTAFGAFQTTKAEGAGIGLSICQKVAEHHSGSISLTPNSHGGLTATLRLAAKSPRD